MFFDLVFGIIISLTGAFLHFLIGMIPAFIIFSIIACIWKAIFPDNLNGDYIDYDIVLSGHSHYPHVFQKFYEFENPDFRNKKSVLFINPGSVGQPRNHNPNAQYAILDTDSMGVDLRYIEYPKDKAMALYDGSIDEFYKKRLENGI